MLKILDKYIIKKLLSTYLFTVLILVAVIMVIDYTEKNQEFISNKVPWKAIMFDYYINYMPYIANMLSPITVFIAAVFFTAKLASHTEIIAVLSSGISYKRFLLPYVLGSSLIAILIFGLIGWVIPKANKKRLNFEHTNLRSQFYYEGRNVHIKTAPTSYLYLESYNNVIKTGYQFTLEEIENRKLKKKVKANRIVWNPNSNAWTMEYYTVHTFDGMKETISNGYNKDTVFSLKPEDFETRDLNFETYTLTELNDYINLLKSRGADNVEIYLIDMYERIAYPFAIIILALMGAISSSKKSRGGTSLQIAFGFVMAFVYIILVTMSRSIGKAGSIPPIWAAWTPNLVFLVIGYIMYWRVPK